MRFVLLLSVLVSLYICYRIDTSLKNGDDAVKEEMPTTEEKDVPKIRSQVGKRVVTSDGRFVQRPTYKTIFGVLASLEISGTFQAGKLVHKFGYGIPIRLLQMVELIGYGYLLTL